MTVTIREERPEDIAAIRLVNDKAFGQPQEGQLVEALRKNGGVLLSLVAVEDGRVVGHVLYSPVSIESGGKEIVGVGLGPMAVLPKFQRQGITCEWNVPADVFMVLVNDPERMSSVSGLAKYRPEFSSVA